MHIVAWHGLPLQVCQMLCNAGCCVNCKNKVLLLHCICLMAFFHDNPGKPARKGKPFWILLEQDVMVWQGQGNVTLMSVCSSNVSSWTIWPAQVDILLRMAICQLILQRGEKSQTIGYCEWKGVRRFTAACFKWWWDLKWWLDVKLPKCHC